MQKAFVRHRFDNRRHIQFDDLRRQRAIHDFRQSDAEMRLRYGPEYHRRLGVKLH